MSKAKKEDGVIKLTRIVLGLAPLHKEGNYGLTFRGESQENWGGGWCFNVNGKRYIARFHKPTNKFIDKFGNRYPAPWFDSNIGKYAIQGFELYKRILD